MSDSPVKELSRRGFISKVGQSLVVANVAGTFLKRAAAQEPLIVPDAPGKKLGWAVVGLGELSIYEILPAFAECEKSKLVALVSGHPDNAGKLAARYGVNSKNIYNYQIQIPSGTTARSTSSISFFPTACMRNTPSVDSRQARTY